MLLSELFEMAKSATKRRRAAKRARKNKAENPTPEKMSNPVAKHAQVSGAGAHSDPKKYNRKSRKEGKRLSGEY